MLESMSGTWAITFYWDVERLTKYFKNNTKINPKAIEDVNAIRERMPCNYDVIQSLNLVVSQMNGTYPKYTKSLHQSMEFASLDGAIDQLFAAQYNGSRCLRNKK